MAGIQHKGELPPDMDLSAVAQHMNAKISITNASSMLRKRIGKNLPQYTEMIIHANNALVDIWEKEILREIADSNGDLQCDNVWNSWVTFEEGIGLTQIQDSLENIPRLSQDQIDFWREFFLQDLEVIHSFGTGLVNRGWSLITDEVRIRFALEKWDKVYSKTEDPAEWFKIASKNKDFFNPASLSHPFFTKEELEDVNAKVHTILHTRVTPKEYKNPTISIPKALSMLKQKVSKNMPRYTEKIILANNALLDRWSTEVLCHLTDENGEIPCEKMWNSWYVFEEGEGIGHLLEYVDFIPRLSQTQIDFWRDFFLQDIDVLHGFGTGLVNRGWMLLTDEVKIRFALDKWRNVYSKSTSPLDSFNIANANEEFFNPTKIEHPFYTKDELEDVVTKVNTILRVRITPEE